MSAASRRTPVPRAPEGRAADDAPRMRMLLEAISELSGELELDVLLGRAMDVSTRLVEADRSSLFIYDHERDELWSKVAQGIDTHSLRFPAAKGLAGAAARSGEIVNVVDAYGDERFNPEFDRATGYETRSVLCVPMKDVKGRVLGAIQVLNRAGGAPFGPRDEEMLSALGSHVAVFIENAQLHESIETLFESFVRSASTAIEERDPTTSGHSKRVAKYALKLARAVHEERISVFTRARMRQLRYAALLHDFGKIGVRESVLTKRNKLADEGLELITERLRRMELEGTDTDLDAALKLVSRANVPGRLSEEDLEQLRVLGETEILGPREVECLSVARGNLTPAEWDDMRSHADRSLHILAEMPWPEEYARVPEIAHRHHEKLDGSGYPSGLAGDDIDLDARILGIADIYDALTAEDRSYKPAMPHERASEILLGDAEAGRLDAGLVRLFLEKALKETEAAGDTQALLHAS
ncbi:MAG: GAF and HD-GYP domain-containing protein [Planctomycetota bacterium]